MELFSMAFEHVRGGFEFDRCLFEYQGQEFMLYPGNEKRHLSVDTLAMRRQSFEEVFKKTHEFLCLFGWANQCSFYFLSGSSIPYANRELLLKNIEPVHFHIRRCHDKNRFLFISDSNSSEDFKKALALYNESQCTNNIFYQFLCLYNILDLPIKGEKRDPEVWINENIDKILTKQGTSERKFVEEKENFGKFIKDECRNAIAHVHRNDPKKSSVLVSSWADNLKIGQSTVVLEDFVDWFIRNEIENPKREEIRIINLEHVKEN